MHVSNKNYNNVTQQCCFSLCMCHIICLSSNAPKLSNNSKEINRCLDEFYLVSFVCVSFLGLKYSYKPWCLIILQIFIFYDILQILSVFFNGSRLKFHGWIGHESKAQSQMETDWDIYILFYSLGILEAHASIYILESKDDTTSDVDPY